MNNYDIKFFFQRTLDNLQLPEVAQSKLKEKYTNIEQMQKFIDTHSTNAFNISPQQAIRVLKKVQHSEIPDLNFLQQLTEASKIPNFRSEFIVINGLTYLNTLIFTLYQTQSEAKLQLTLQSLLNLADCVQGIKFISGNFEVLRLLSMIIGYNNDLLVNICLKIFTAICLSKQGSTNAVSGNLKQVYYNFGRFEKLIVLLKQSNNIDLILNVLIIIQKIIDNDYKLQEELIQGGFTEIFDNLKEKVVKIINKRLKFNQLNTYLPQDEEFDIQFLFVNNKIISNEDMHHDIDFMKAGKCLKILINYNFYPQIIDSDDKSTDSLAILAAREADSQSHEIRQAFRKICIKAKENQWGFIQAKSKYAGIDQLIDRVGEIDFDKVKLATDEELEKVIKCDIIVREKDFSIQQLERQVSQLISQLKGQNYGQNQIIPPPGNGLPPPPPGNGLPPPPPVNGLPPPPPGNGLPPPPPVNGLPPPPPGNGLPPPPPVNGLPPPPPGNGLPPPPPVNGLPPPPPGNGLPPPPPVNGLPPPPPGNGLPPPPPVNGLPPPPPGNGLPPPPPGNGPSSIPKKNQINKPTLKVKQFFWDKTKDQEIKPDSIWASIGAADIQFNETEIETLSNCFYQESKPKEEEKPQKPKLITILEPKRIQQMEIALNRLKLPHHSIKLKIINFETFSPIDHGIDTLLHLVPTNEEIQTLLNALKVNSNITLYQKPDQFIYTVSDIRNLKSLVEKWLFMINFRDDFSTLQDFVSTFEQLFNTLLTSESWFSFLKLTLSIGNFLNYNNTNRGFARGFKLKSLLKLLDFKSNSGQNLVQILFKMLSSDQKNDLAKLFAIVKKTLKFSFSEQSQQLLAVQAKFCEQQVENNCKIGQKFDEFRTRNGGQVQLEVEKLGQLTEQFEAVKQFYCEGKGVKIEDFLLILVQFGQGCEKVFVVKRPVKPVKEESIREETIENLIKGFVGE